MQKKNPNADQKSSLSSEQREILRHKCLTDLYFLCKEVLGYKDFVQHVHQPMCDTYLKIRPGIPLLEQSDIKTRMILAPRGTFKTTAHLGHIVQLILAFPDIRILLLTGTQDLAWRMVGEIKRHFMSNDYLRELFPEMCPPRDKKWGTDDAFICPARTKVLREPTLSSSTLDSVKAGVHVEVIGIDDSVNEVNSTTITQCQKIVDAYDSLTYILEPGGFTNINGTRYKSYDLYGKLLERYRSLLDRIAKARAEDDHEEEDDVEVVNFQCTILSAWTLLDPSSLVRDGNGAYILKKSSVSLLFPERLKFRALYKQYRDNPSAFACQMLNDPDQSVDDERPFTDHLIEQHTVRWDQLPLPSTTQDFILWDLAGANQEGNRNRDYSVGVVGRYSQDKGLFIVDMVRGRWDAVQIAIQIAQLAKSYPNADFTRIEDSTGARMLEPTINMVASKMGISVPLVWVKIPRFLGAKRFRIDALAQYFRADKLWLAAFLPYRDQLKTELLEKTPEHDDCADAIALLVKELGIVAATSGKDGVPEPDKKAIRERMFLAAVYGDDDTYTIEHAPDTPEEPKVFKAGILGYGHLC